MRVFFLISLFLSAHTFAFTVTMSATTDGTDRPTVLGRTNLPDGIELLVTINRRGGDYKAQDSTKVVGGAFHAGPFSQKGSGLNPGIYTLEVVMPVPNIQPPSTWPAIGNGGANMQGALVHKSPIGGNVVTYKSTFKVGGGHASVEKDNAAKTQDSKDSHTWWLQSCNDTCRLAQNVAKRRSEQFDQDRCYYGCVADEPKKNGK